MRRVITAAEQHPKLVGLAVAVRQITTRLRIDSQAFVVLPRDDVDNAADRVGAVDRRCPVLEDLDPFDDIIGNRIEIHRAGNAGCRRAGDPAPTVHQHQRPLCVHVANRKVHRAGADTRAILRKAGVPRHIELRIDRRTRDRQLP